MYMQPFSFRVNQVVVVQNENIPYGYEFAKILQRRQNQDQAYQYQIKLYKQKHIAQSIPVDTFKIKKMNVKIFYSLKQKCEQYPELSQSFRSVEFQLSKNQVFIEQQQKDKIWKKLFKKTILYFQAKRSARIKQRSNQKQTLKQLSFESIKNMALSKNKMNLNCKIQISQIKKYVSKNKCLKLNSVGNKFNKQIFSKSNKKKAFKQISKSKSKTKMQQKPPNLKIANQSILNERYRCLFLFGLNYIASQEKMLKIQQYFQQDQADQPDDIKKKSQEVQSYLDQLKALLFSFHFEDFKNMQVKISALENLLTIKLKHILHSQLSIFCQSILEKTILLIKIYYLKQIASLKSIIITLKIWLKLFIQKMGKKGFQTEQFNNKTYSQFKLLVEQILNHNPLE